MESQVNINPGIRSTLGSLDTPGTLASDWFLIIIFAPAIQSYDNKCTPRIVC